MLNETRAPRLAAEPGSKPSHFSSPHPFLEGAGGSAQGACFQGGLEGLSWAWGF